MDSADARALFATARVVRLASASADGRPHLVPVCFALEHDTLYSAVDHKPKRSATRLRRLDNIAANPSVTVVADHYEEHWSALWWARADGSAKIVAAGEPEHARAVTLLAERYEQYRARAPGGPAIVVAVERWSGWRASEDSDMRL